MRDIKLSNPIYRYARHFKEPETRFKQQVIEACSWSEATYYRKLKPGADITPAYRTAIDQIARKLARSISDKRPYKTDHGKATRTKQ